MPKMRIKLVANPISGGEARPKIDRAVSRLEQQGADVELFLTTGRGDARAAAATAAGEGFDRVMAAGGDGTLNEVVNGVRDSDCPVAFLPLGTVNVFALEAGIPFGIDAACQLAMTGTPRRITLGGIADERFLLMASVGWDAEAVARMRPALKRRLGRLAYGVSAIEAFLVRPPAPLQVDLPGIGQQVAYGVVASNCRYYGGRYVITPEASMFDESLEVCLICKPGRLAQLQFAACLATGRQLPQELASFYTVKTLSIRSGFSPVPMQVDGDAWGELPVEIQALPNAVAVILPERVCP